MFKMFLIFFVRIMHMYILILQIPNPTNYHWRINRFFLRNSIIQSKWHVRYNK